jgi:ribose transport system substrate-binding protein
VLCCFQQTSISFPQITTKPASKANNIVTTFERRRRILRLLREQSGLKVTELAQLLDVSEGTIRNDLTALEEEGHLTRVRGGAILNDGHLMRSSAFMARARVNVAAKQRIGRWAADMVEDGDSILLDASTTISHMAPFLQDLNNLTIVTNGVEVGLTLARNPSHTVILIGGVLRYNDSSVVGHLGEKILDDLHIKTAFMSCSGFSVETGLTQTDIQEAQLKSRMIRSAERVVALIDSSKFGKVDLTPFASVEHVSQILTDSNVDPRVVEQLRQTCAVLTVCGESTVSSFTPCGEETAHYKIGFANLSEQIPFAVDVRRGLEQAAQNASNVDLIVADNQLSGGVALNVADHLIRKGVDLVIEYQLDEKMGSVIMDKFRQLNIPVIAVDIPMVGATYFGVDNYRAGHMAGVALGNWARENWNGAFDRLVVLEEPRAGALPAARILGQIDGLQEVVGEIPQSKVIYLESGNTSDVSEAHMVATLNATPNAHRLAVISFNDDAAIGALAAARKAGRETDVVIVGQGADRIVREEIWHRDSRIIGSTAFWPEKYGPRLIEVAAKILRGEQLPPAIYMDHMFINSDNIAKFYSR